MAEKNARSSPAALAFMRAAAALYHAAYTQTSAHLDIAHTRTHTLIHTHTRRTSNTLLPPVRFPLTHAHTQSHLHFPAYPVTVDVITAFNLRGIRLPLTDLTAFTTQASRRL